MRILCNSLGLLASVYFSYSIVDCVVCSTFVSPLSLPPSLHILVYVLYGAWQHYLRWLFSLTTDATPLAYALLPFPLPPSLCAVFNFLVRVHRIRIVKQNLCAQQLRRPPPRLTILSTSLFLLFLLLLLRFPLRLCGAAITFIIVLCNFWQRHCPAGVFHSSAVAPPVQAVRAAADVVAFASRFPYHHILLTLLTVSLSVSLSLSHLSCCFLTAASI